MPRKRTKKTVKKTKKFSWRKYFFLLAGISVLALGSILFTNKLNQPGCANSISCINDLSGKYDESAKTGYFMGKQVTVPSYLAGLENIANGNNQNAVLGDSSDRHIYIDLSNQKLFAKENGNTIYEFLISSGKWGRTPTGDFITWIKLKSTRMTGGNKALGTFYDLPNVPFTMYFYNSAIPKSRGYGIHGAYWHNNFGHPMSHGCINLKPEDARQLFVWANPQSGENSINITSNNPGTPITIYGAAPLN